MAKKKPEAAPEQEIENEVTDLLSQQKDLEEQEAKLMQVPEFAQYMIAQKKFQAQSEIYWESIQQQMEVHNIKSIKGNWGSISLVNKLGFDIDLKELPAKFIKKVADTKKIGEEFKLKGAAPKGATPKYSKFLQKRLK